ncbi:dynein axonemal assembly factor 4 isoform X1 [Xiphophorus hellerii]|uniref:dynein axonemal assembly factor 4 isoform X1 n=1 Tax=Xiphophorus hellerii TaxID=8084 RepID=UPI0013B3931B|nr:dynein assembly factor 4, axonemal isoform X1 [Xiphophorus hellerii]
MPLHVTDYTWTQTDSTVHISVPLKGATAAGVDIVSTEEYLKVHFPPFLFEAFLFEPIDDDRSSAKVGNGVAVFTLPKKTHKVWEHLMITTDDKETKKEIRERALLTQEQKLSAELKQKAEKRQAEKKYALETMMKLEKVERDRIQQMKDAEREKTTAELAAWQLRQKQEAEKAQQNQNQQIQQNPDTKTPGSRQTDIRKNKQVHSDSEKKKKKIRAQLPPPRTCGNIPVTFTPRVFPTALRESRVPEEEEWLKKQAEARRAMSAELEELEDLTEEERNPDWLKQKGDKCFSNGDYVGAVNAYTLGIRLNRKLPALYSNRAACHLKLRNLHKAVEDSSKALDLLTPAVSANAAARVRARVRRGSAFCQLELYAEGLQDYEAALKIEPHNEALQRDAQIIRDIIQGSDGQNGTQ